MCDEQLGEPQELDELKESQLLSMYLVGSHIQQCGDNLLLDFVNVIVVEQIESHFLPNCCCFELQHQDDVH